MKVFYALPLLAALVSAGDPVTVKCEVDYQDCSRCVPVSRQNGKLWPSTPEGYKEGTCAKQTTLSSKCLVNTKCGFAPDKSGNCVWLMDTEMSKCLNENGGKGGLNVFDMTTTRVITVDYGSTWTGDSSNLRAAGWASLALAGILIFW